MTLTSVLFNFIFYNDTSSLRDECITFCSSFFTNALPGVDDAPFINKTRDAVLLANDTRLMQPFEFHTSINFDFNKKQWIQKELFGSKSVAQHHWTIDNEYNLKYPILRDRQGIKLPPYTTR